MNIIMQLLLPCLLAMSVPSEQYSQIQKVNQWISQNVDKIENYIQQSLITSEELLGKSTNNENEYYNQIIRFTKWQISTKHQEHIQLTQGEVIDSLAFGSNSKYFTNIHNNFALLGAYIHENQWIKFDFDNQNPEVKERVDYFYFQNYQGISIKDADNRIMNRLIVLDSSYESISVTHDDSHSSLFINNLQSDSQIYYFLYSQNQQEQEIQDFFDYFVTIIIQLQSNSNNIQMETPTEEESTPIKNKVIISKKESTGKDKEFETSYIKDEDEELVDECQELDYVKPKEEIKQDEKIEVEENKQDIIHEDIKEEIHEDIQEDIHEDIQEDIHEEVKEDIKPEIEPQNSKEEVQEPQLDDIQQIVDQSEEEEQSEINCDHLIDEDTVYNPPDDDDGEKDNNQKSLKPQLIEMSNINYNQLKAKYSCATLYSECDYKGDMIKLCDQPKVLNNFIIKSIRLPQELNVLDEIQDLEKETIKALQCLDDPINLSLMQINYNLRSKLQNNARKQ